MKKVFKLFPLIGILFVCNLFVGCSNDDNKSTEALILEMSFEEEIVTVQPVINGAAISFAVAYNATEEQLKELKPIIKVSNGAIVNPASGEKVDFSTETVEFIVTAEDGVTTTKYTVSCKKSINTEAEILSMKFDVSDIVVGNVEIKDTNIIIPIKGNTSSSSTKLKKMIPTIEVSDNATIVILGGSDEVIAYEEGMELDFSNSNIDVAEQSPVRFRVTAEDGTTQTIYQASYKKITNNESAILNFSLSSSVITKDAVMDGTSIVYEISNNATVNDLNKLIPTIEISEYATIKPAIGSEIDFSSGNVTFEVTAGDGRTKTKYQVFLWQNKYDFENWFVENPKDETSVQYLAPIAGWSSSNTGAAFLRAMNYTDKLVVTESDKNNTYSGSKAARVETIDTKGGKFLAINIPKITTGTLFIGKFETSIKNTLESTKFGMPYYKKPLKVKGYYKYTPGTDFYRATGMADCDKAQIEKGTIDECAINAILYEVDEKGTYLTGVDAYDETKLTAIAKLTDGTAKDKYTPFELTFNYIKAYDSAKTYRLSIICSSSKWGDTFSGAPGSVLYVDDIEIISE